MEITVNLGTELAERVRAAAAGEGTTLEAYVRTILEQTVPGLPARPDPEVPDLRPACGTHMIDEQVVKPFREWVRARGLSGGDRPAPSA